jgi:hypothetical protein
MVASYALGLIEKHKNHQNYAKLLEIYKIEANNIREIT